MDCLPYPGERKNSPVWKKKQPILKNAGMNNYSLLHTSFPENIMQRAILFAKELPDFQGVKKQNNSIIFEFVVDGKLPVDKLKYQAENIDKYALRAYEKILCNYDKIELLLKDVKFFFVVYFWYKNKIIGEIEFTYLINDRLFNPELKV